MTEKKKISILEQLLDERDAQIRELQRQNEELEGIIDDYRGMDDDIGELRILIKNGHKINAEYNQMNREYNQMKKNFRHDMRKVMKSVK